MRLAFFNPATIFDSAVWGQVDAVGVLRASGVQALWRRYVKMPTQVGWSRIWDLFVLVRWCEMMGLRP